MSLSASSLSPEETTRKSSLICSAARSAPITDSRMRPGLRGGGGGGEDMARVMPAQPPSLANWSSSPCRVTPKGGLGTVPDGGCGAFAFAAAAAAPHWGFKVASRLGDHAWRSNWPRSSRVSPTPVSTEPYGISGKASVAPDGSDEI